MKLLKTRNKIASQKLLAMYREPRNKPIAFFDAELKEPLVEKGIPRYVYSLTTSIALPCQNQDSFAANFPPRPNTIILVLATLLQSGASSQNIFLTLQCVVADPEVMSQLSPCRRQTIKFAPVRLLPTLRHYYYLSVQ